MQLRTRTWLVICVLALVGAAVFWRLGEQRLAERTSNRRPPAAPAIPAAAPAAGLLVAAPGIGHAGVIPASLREAAAAHAASAPNTAVPPAANAANAAADPRASLRLRNTTRSADELARDAAALLLRNALIDTAAGGALSLPAHLRAAAEAGSYIVQARGAISPAFRSAISDSGASIVSYLPNNAYLVEASAAQSGTLKGKAEVQAVMPFEPYFKLETPLLAKAVNGEELASGTRLNLTLLPSARDQGITELRRLGAEVVAEFKTPFGPAVTIDPAAVSLADIARLPAVQGIELFRNRQLLNDLTRGRLGVSQGTNAPGAYTNHLGLDGTNVFININDSGVDSTHPDLKGRVTGDLPSTLIDLDGHGTHVAGTIAGSGMQSGSVSNVPPGSVPNADYRGMAPAAKLYAQPIDLITGPLISDAYLQQSAATNHYITGANTNLLISNNSWGYIGLTEYSVASAGYDAATRDALPDTGGSQPILYVFASGNEGFGADDGQGGEPNGVRSPGTAKNVITVGSIESPRNITNEVIFPDSDGNLSTNKVFMEETDTDYQVSAFSSRGNVEPGVEGLFGRFKPDVVAPGSFTISTRSKDWQDPRSFSDAIVARLVNQGVPSGGFNLYSLFVPPQAGEFRVRLLPNLQSPDPFPGLPLYVHKGSPATAADLVNTNNLVRVPPDLPISSGVWYYGVGNLTGAAVSYDVLSVITLTNDFGNYFDELKRLNDGVGPHYRYESGTSMAAPAVTGVLALFQDYFQRQHKPTTPALLKALLINGTRSLGSTYNFNLRDIINLQGWGLVNLTNTIPADEIGSPTGGVYAVQYTSQTGKDSLVTGQNKTWKVKLTPAAQDQILKVTLVWTDPPGNPNAAVKLVNNLDLEVKNNDTGEIYAGNEIPYRSDFNVVHTPDDQSSITNDVINNVENILLRPPLGTNYTITVRGRRVNVNAVTSHPDGIAQDFALVAGLENPSITNAMEVLPDTPELAVNLPQVNIPTNGLALLSQHVGANPPKYGTLPGATNQWTFFVFTNLQDYTPPFVGITNGPNVAFITFLPPNLAAPRYKQADIDLYVSTDPALSNLAPSAIIGSSKSTKPGGTELVYFTNAPMGQIYYVGVKAEDQQAAEFGFVVLSSAAPFDEDDQNGNRIVHGLPYRMAIPDGSPDQPQAAYIFGVATKSFEVERVVVTNTVSYDSTGDVLGNLSHDDAFVVLSNHALSPGGIGGIITVVYDDSNANDTSYGSLQSRPTDGPGRLSDFVGAEATGPWILSVVDNAVTQTATNVAMTLRLEPKPPDEGFFDAAVMPNSVNFYYIDVPSNATNLVVEIKGITPNLPLLVALRRGNRPTFGVYDKGARIDARGGRVAIGRRDVPPLNPGRYYIGVFNPHGVPVNYSISVEVDLDLTVSAEASYGLNQPVEISDDARQFSILTIGEDLEIADIKVGVRLDHPRIADLALHVISPQGTRLLLSENRGGPDGTAYGGSTGVRKIYTTFTDNTNLTTTPIKLGKAPFTNSPVNSGASNRVLMSDSFELAVPRTYGTGERIAPGWVALAGSVQVVRSLPGATNIADGIQYLAFPPGGQNSVATNVTLTPRQYYYLRFAANNFGGTETAGISVWVNGSFVVTFQKLGSGWYEYSALIHATAVINQIEFRNPQSFSAWAIDHVSLVEADPPQNSYYLPEEPLKPFIGQRAVGDWKLEVTDSRQGPVSTQFGEFDWRLELVYAQPGLFAVKLTNDIPYFGVISGNEVQYFYVEVPNCATTADNTLAGQLGTMLLFGDREGLPRADLSQFLDDYGPYLNVESGGLAQFKLTTKTPQSAPLIPGQRYYLAVRNFQPDLTNNAFGIRVKFDCVDPALPTVPSLTNGVPTIATLDPGPVLHYYQFVVSSNAIRADFELTPISGGNVDMYVRFGRLDDYPLPSPNLYDYASENPDPAVTDLIGVERISLPMPLIPGTWYVAVRNSEVVPVQYSVKVTESYTDIITLTNAVAYQNTIGPTDQLTGLSSTNLQYYGFYVSSNSVRANFETLGADGNVNLYVRKGLPIATPFDFHFSGVQGGTADEFITVSNTTSPVWLAPGWWYLTVENADIANVAYSIRATEFPASITVLTNNVAVTNTIATGPEPNYYSFRVSSEALSAKFEVFEMSDNVDLLLRRGLPVPTLHDSHYTSANVGLTDEVIELTPFSFPTNLGPGDWYLSVINSSTNNATYTIRATEQVARIVTLTNGIPQNAAIQPGPGLDYYQFNVSPGATAAEFKLTSASTGDLDLYLKKGPPLPDGINSHYAALTPGTGDELIHIETNSLPVPLSPGIWYLAVTNKEPVPIGYEITATEFGVEPPVTSGLVTNIVIDGNSACITWISIPGTNYFVVARTNALEAVWTPVSPTITATDITTTWCLVPVGSWRFFDVRQGESPVAPIPEPVPVLRFDGDNVCVSWASVPGTKYHVEGKKVFNDTDWTVLTPSITANSGQTEVCYLISLGYRFFRVGVGELGTPTPVPIPSDDVDVAITVDQICVSWPTKPGLDYLVEGKRDVADPNWTVISEPLRGDGTPQSLCLSGNTEFRYFQVIEGVSVPLSTPPSVPVPGVRLSVDPAFQLCLTWATLRGAEYFVEAKERIGDSFWTVISPILPAPGIELSFCQPINSQWRYFQVRRVNSVPDPAPHIDVIEIGPTGPRLAWNGPAGARYQVFYSDVLPPVWKPVGGAVTSVTGAFEFVDDGVVAGPLGSFRLYRIQRLP